MASISRLLPSAASFSLEVAPALANFNFDFSLYKVQPPKEFEGVGSALSIYRREEAEHGTPHITARKLGALFGGLIPSTPELSKAYGERASEISQASSMTPKDRNNYGAFASRVGADATSIWAAATSGQEAIAIHLLACLLARIWDGPKASSIWVEMVRCRKEHIIADFDENNIVGLASLAAAKQDLTRSQLAEWDSSARAWLRAADSVKKRQQKQLMLIIDNLQTPVNRKSDTYQSVMSAWTNALTQMEGLVQGIPQKAQSGDILLALSAWHLFPNMTVVVPCVAHIFQHDPIFAHGGVLTIGLENPHSEHNGVYWSLPLAHLRHYGAPVLSACSINSRERARISIEEFLQAVLGCFVDGWGEAGSNTEDAVNWLSQLSDLLHHAVSTGSKNAHLMIRGLAESSWLNLMLVAAKNHLGKSGNDRLTASKLISLGRKHGKSFLGLPCNPLFGLLYRGAFVGLIKGEEEKIRYLRRIAKDIMVKSGFEARQMFIRYRRHDVDVSEAVFEYTTAVPWPRETLKRKFQLSDHDVEGHVRWLYAGGYIPKNGNFYDDRRPFRPYMSYKANFTAADPAQFSENEFIPADHQRWHQSQDYNHPLFVYDNYDDRKKHYESMGEHVFKREDQAIEDLDPHKLGIFWDRSRLSESYKGPLYKLIYGDMETAALFVSESEAVLIDLYRKTHDDMIEFYTLFETKSVDINALIERLISTFRMANVEADPHFKSLKAVSTAALLYKDFPNATIDVRILQRTLYDVSWVKLFNTFQVDAKSTGPDFGVPYALQPYILDRKTAFACITMFESGRYDIEPTDLENVMAMSSEDSLYISSKLLLDPFDKPVRTIQHVSGNIGRPGIAFLVPPIDPLIKEVSIDEWPQINRNKFNGELKNCFDSTSLHLSFTGANTPYNVGFTGAQDSEVYMMETLISVHECDRWIADINPLRLYNTLKPCLNLTGLCEYGNTKTQIVCIDNWLELIDRPEERICLVRSYKNWQARLAAASLSVQMGFQMVVLPEKVCWKSFDTDMEKYKNVVLIG